MVAFPNIQKKNMKKITLSIWCILTIMLFLESCKKAVVEVKSPATVNVINAIPTSAGIIPVFGTTAAIQYFRNAQELGYTGFGVYYRNNGNNNIYILEDRDTTSLAIKSSLFMGTLDLKSGNVYSLFLTGDTTKVDTLLVEDHIPYYSDSTSAVRFVNLSTGSPAISVSLQGNSTPEPEFADLRYKTVSTWKGYSATSDIGGAYTFVISDKITGNELTEFTWYYTPYKSNAIVISGSTDPTSDTSLQVFEVNYY